MRSSTGSRRCGWFAACVVLAVEAVPAQAVSLPVAIELRLEIAALEPATLSSVGAATVNGSGAGGHLDSVALDAAQLADSTLVPIPDEAAAPITGVAIVVANRAGSVAETAGGGMRGAIGLQGAAKICLFGGIGCVAPLANINVPLTVVGEGGFAVATGPVSLTVFGAPWTTGQVAIGTITRRGGARGPLSATSSTAQSGGEIQLVTPVHISTNIGASAVVPIFATLTLRFVPEPATLALLALGIGALATAGRRKR